MHVAAWWRACSNASAGLAGSVFDYEVYHGGTFDVKTAETSGGKRGTGDGSPP